MDPTVIAILATVMLLGMVILGVHVGVALAATGVLGLWVIKNNFVIALSVLGTTCFNAVSAYVFGVIPMFILMGLFSNESGASDDLYNSANTIFRKVRGGLGIATVMANAIFAAITGVSIASAAMFSKVALPQMARFNYNRKFALGIIAGSSVLGMLIPPSFLFIIYGMITEEAIGKLFIAGVLPGILLVLGLALSIFLAGVFNPDLAGTDRQEKTDLPFKEILKALFAPWPVYVLIGLVLGGIYSGHFTPTEAGAVGAAGAFLMALLKKRLTLKSLWKILLETGYTTAGIFFLVIGALVYSRMLAISGLPARTAEFAVSFQMPPIIIVLFFVLVLLFLGAILDSTSILLITIPIMAPVISSLNYDLIWFGVVAVIAVEAGLLTPPFGMVVFSMKAALSVHSESLSGDDEITIEEIFSGSFPFMVLILVILAIIIIFPSLSLWLVSLM